MPDLTELKDVNAVLKDHRDDPTSQPDLHTQLRQSIRGVTHESVDVRRHALSKLRDLLHKNQVCSYFVHLMYFRLFRPLKKLIHMFDYVYSVFIFTTLT